MKLVTYTHSGMPRLGVVVKDMVIDLPLAYEAILPEREKPRSFRNGFPQDMLTYLQSGVAGQRSVMEIIRRVNKIDLHKGKWSFVYPLSQIQIEAPLRNPSKIICIGLNYADHCREQNLEIPQSLILFAKFPSAIIGPDERITWSPETTQQVDYEAELAVVIGRQAKGVASEDALDYVAGYTIANDVSARDVQFGDKQWVRGKSFDTFCPLGPYIVTADEIGDPHNLSICCWVNSEIRQDSNTDQMIFNIPKAISFISRTCTLLPGDIILTGTPDGVGVFRDPPHFLKPGDEVLIEIEKLGQLHNLIF